MGTYIHGDSRREQERLGRLNAITNASFIHYLDLKDGLNVADFGCGLGNLMVDIARAYPSIRVTGLEISERQCANARANTRPFENLDVVNTDILANGLPDNCFDLTYCRYLLEHVGDPVKTVKEMMRVTKPGGVVACQENDLHNVLYYPEIEGMVLVMKGFCRFQTLLGGDPYIGRRLYTVFRQAGAKDIRLAYHPEIYTDDNVEGYRAWMENARNILQGAREELINRDLIDPALFDRTCALMADRIDEPLGVALFHWNRIKARK